MSAFAAFDVDDDEEEEELRFEVDDRVIYRGPDGLWIEGTVMELWHRKHR